jgi:hypothetical protein
MTEGVKEKEKRNETRRRDDSRLVHRLTRLDSTRQEP